MVMLLTVIYLFEISSNPSKHLENFSAVHDMLQQHTVAFYTSRKLVDNQHIFQRIFSLFFSFTFFRTLCVRASTINVDFLCFSVARGRTLVQFLLPGSRIRSSKRSVANDVLSVLISLDVIGNFISSRFSIYGVVSA